MKRKVTLFVLTAVLINTISPGILNQNVFAAATAYSRTTYKVEQDILLSDFETGVDGWSAGTNVSAVSRVSTISNSPAKPYNGDYCLETTTASGAVPGTSWRSVYKSFSTPIDLSNTPYIVLAVNTWGINASHPNFDIKVDVYSGTNTISSTTTFNANKWTPIIVNISDWSYKNSVSKIEVSFRSQTYTAYWVGKQQIDYIGYSASEKWDFNKDSNFEGWTINSQTSGASVSGGYLNYSISGIDPYMHSPTAFITDASYTKYLSVRLKNMSPDTKGRLYWKTIVDNTWTQSKSCEFSINPNDTSYTTYGCDLSSNSAWANKITQIRLDLPDAGSGSGSVSVAYIQLSTRPEDVYYSGAVNNVSATSSQIVVSGNVNCTSAKTIDIIELQPYEEYNFFKSYTPVASASVIPSNGTANFNISFNRYSNSVDKIYSKFVVIVNDTVIKKLDIEKYVTTFPDSENSFAYPEAESIKGLQVQMVDDAQKLGISHAALNVGINSLFYVDNSNPSDTITYTMDGETFYLCKSYIEGLDGRIKSLSDNNIIVTLILIMYNSRMDSTSPNISIIHPDHTSDGIVFAINSTNAAGVKYWKAAMEFIVGRYTREDQIYGRAVNYIIGNEVDLSDDWNNMGEKELCDYIDQYSRTLRIAYTAAMKKYDNARIFISLAHNWNVAGGTNVWDRYKGRSIVDGINSRVKEQGNIPWNIAYHPYPENLGDPRIWEDTSTTNSYDTTKINFKNLNILSDYIGQPDYLINGNRRRIILSEEGFHSLSNSLDDQKVQAAAYAYSYYKAKFTPGIDAFILHRHVDSDAEGGLLLGLWMRDTSNTIPNAPGTRKYIYDVFKKIDTSESETVSAFAKTIIGITDWSQIIPGWDNTQLADHSLPSTFTINTISPVSPTTYISDFENGTDGWTNIDYCWQSERVSDMVNSPGTAYNGTYMLSGKLTVSDSTGGATAEAGLVKEFSSPIDVSAVPKFQFAINSYGGCPGATQYYCTVRIYSGTHIAEGKVTILPNQWNKLQMDISGWNYNASIDKIKIWFSTDSKSLWEGQYQIDNLGFKN